MSSASGRAWKRSFQVLFSAAGPQSGWRRQIDEDRRRDEHGRDGAGDDVSEEELPDRLPRVDPVDDQDDAGRDQDAERRPGGDGTGVQDRVVMVFLHRRDGDGAHRRRGRRVRAADRGKGRTGHDRRDRQSPPVMAEPPVRRVVEAVVVARVVDELPDEDEHRDHREAVAGEDVPHLPADHPQGGRKRGRVGKAEETDDRHREARRNPQQKEGGEHDGDPGDAQKRSAHGASPSFRNARGMSRRQVSVRMPKPAATPKTKGW